MTDRNSKGQFLPGTSGNPSGRPKSVKGARERYQEHAQEVFELAIARLRNPETGGAEFASLFKEFQLRAWGKPQTGEEVQREEDQSVTKSVQFEVIDKRSQLTPQEQEDLALTDD